MRESTDLGQMEKRPMVVSTTQRRAAVEYVICPSCLPKMSVIHFDLLRLLYLEYSWYLRKQNV